VVPVITSREEKGDMVASRSPTQLEGIEFGWEES
jgi:hypothetical protein